MSCVSETSAEDREYSWLGKKCDSYVSDTHGFTLTTQRNCFCVEVMVLFKKSLSLSFPKQLILKTIGLFLTFPYQLWGNNFNTKRTSPILPTHLMMSWSSPKPVGIIRWAPIFSNIASKSRAGLAKLNFDSFQTKKYTREDQHGTREYIPAKGNESSKSSFSVFYVHLPGCISLQENRKYN